MLKHLCIYRAIGWERKEDSMEFEKKNQNKKCQFFTHTY